MGSFKTGSAASRCSWAAATTLLVPTPAMAGSSIGADIAVAFIALLASGVLAVVLYCVIAVWLVVFLFRRKRPVIASFAIFCLAVVPFLVAGLQRHAVATDFKEQCLAIRDVQSSIPPLQDVTSVYVTQRYSPGFVDGRFGIETSTLNGPGGFRFVEVDQGMGSTLALPVVRHHGNRYEPVAAPSSELEVHLEASTIKVARSHRIDSGRLSVIRRSTGQLLSSRQVLMLRKDNSLLSVFSLLMPWLATSPGDTYCGSDFEVTGRDALGDVVGKAAFAQLLKVARPAAL